MATYTGKTRIGFLPRMAVAMDATGVTLTPDALKATLGPLAALDYKPTRLKAYVTLSSAPTTGAAKVVLYNGASEIKSVSLSITGVTEIAVDAGVDLSAVSGDGELSVGVDVTAAADAGITAEMTAYLDIEQPVAQTGC